MESERAEGREERGENGPLDDRRRRRIHCRNGGSQIAEILISNIFFVWKSVAGAFLSCVRRAARPLAQPGRGGQSHLRLEGRREVGAAKMFRTLPRKIPWVMHGSTSCLAIKRCSRSWSQLAGLTRDAEMILVTEGSAFSVRRPIIRPRRWKREPAATGCGFHFGT